MKKFLKWAAFVILLLAGVGFLAFLYLIPPFTLVPPEEFSRPEAAAAPAVDGIADPAERLLAERGKYLVTVGACIGCHMTPGPQGPTWEMYMAGGFKMSAKGHGTFVSANLTPDKETGLARRSDEEVKRVLRSGVAADGRPIVARLMPWPAYANWTDEDLHAVVVYLRHLKPVPHRIPPPLPASALTDAGATEEDYGGADYGMKP